MSSPLCPRSHHTRKSEAWDVLRCAAFLQFLFFLQTNLGAVLDVILTSGETLNVKPKETPGWARSCISGEVVCKLWSPKGAAALKITEDTRTGLGRFRSARVQRHLLKCCHEGRSLPCKQSWPHF